MPSRVPLACFSTLVLWVAPALCQDVILYDNGVIDTSGLPGVNVTTVTAADDFELPFSALCSRVSFGMYDSTCTFPANWDGGLRWWIYEDSGTFPGALVATGFAQNVGHTPFFNDCPDGAWHIVTFALGRQVSLSTGVRYWLALHMAYDWDSTDGIAWAFTTPGAYTPMRFRPNGSGSWISIEALHTSFAVGFSSDDEYLFVDGFESGDATIWSVTQP